MIKLSDCHYIVRHHRSIVEKRLYKIVTKLRVAQRDRGPWMMFILSTRSTRTYDVQWIRTIRFCNNTILLLYQTVSDGGDVYNIIDLWVVQHKIGTSIHRRRDGKETCFCHFHPFVTPRSRLANTMSAKRTQYIRV